MHPALRRWSLFRRGGIALGAILWWWTSPSLQAQTPVVLTLSNLNPVYDGLPKLPSVSSTPDGLSVDLTFSAPAGDASSQVVFQSTPATLQHSYTSVTFAGTNNISGLGDYIRLAGSARYLNSVETVLVNYAKASDWPALAAQNPEGYFHPIRIHVFRVASDGGLQFFAERTQQVLVPWRPLTLPNGDPYPANGIAFQVKIDFPGNLILSQDHAVMVSYNTQSTGFNPIGKAGPYNSLNTALVATTPTVGTDLNPAGYLSVKNGAFLYPNASSSIPLFKVNASTSPRPAISVPVNAGTYEVTATVTSPGYTGQATATFTIHPAPVEIQLSNLLQVADGSPKPVSAATTPGGVNVKIEYDGSETAPSAIGAYAVVATVTSPNHTGAATSELRIGHDFASWIQQKVTAGAVAPEDAGELADPDDDSLPNLLEYAFSLDPAAADSHNPLFEFSSGAISLTYVRNLDAIDLAYQVETSTDLESGSWQDAVTEDTILSTVGNLRTIRATYEPPPGETRRFLRLKVTAGE